MRMFWTGEMLIGLLLSASVPYLAFKINTYLHDKSDPSWKKKD